MNISTRQLVSTLEILGDFAYKKVFVYDGSNENWITLKTVDPKLTRVDLAMMFPAHFKTAFADYDPAVISVRNTKVS